jgi:hypothetical protein
VERQRPRTEQAVRQEGTPIGRLDRLKDFLAFPLRLEQGQVQELRGPWDRRKKRQSKPHALGQTVLCTDRQELAPHRLGLADRRQAKVEEMGRISKRRRPGWWWPASHWTDSTLSVPALACLVALRLIRTGLRRRQERNLAIGGGPPDGTPARAAGGPGELCQRCCATGQHRAQPRAGGTVSCLARKAPGRAGG